MNNMSKPNLFTNNVKFTGSAFETPGDAATILLQFVLLLMIILGLEDRRN